MYAQPRVAFKKTSVNAVPFTDTTKLDADPNMLEPFLAIVRLLEPKVMQGKFGEFHRASFEFVDWKPRKDTFVIPTFDAPNDDDWISPNAGLSDKVDEQIAKSGDITEDDLPF